MELAFDGLVCDMDGVIYRGAEPIPGSVEAIRPLREAGVRILFCTNNSRSTVEGYVAKLGGMGIEAGPADILTSAVVTGEVLAGRDLEGKRALVVGGDGVREAVAAAGLEIVEDPEGRRAEVVTVGWDPGFTYTRMKEASLAVRAGALLIATNDDASFPAADGLWPGAGAVLASIETASGATAEVMGKPHEPMMRAAAARLAGCERIAIVGDRPDTDIAGGSAMGWTTILVLSGVTVRADLDSVRPVPDLVVERLVDLVQ
jgi:4-nitrophenyl phosphatase